MVGVRASANPRYAGVLECDCFYEAILLFNPERPPAATFGEGTQGREEGKPGGCARGRKGEMPERRVFKLTAGSKGKGTGMPAVYQSCFCTSRAGFTRWKGGCLPLRRFFIIRVGRVENPIRAPDKRLNNSEQNLKMERSARALCTLMIGFRPWIMNQANILVCDDEVEVADLLKHVLEREGFAVVLPLGDAALTLLNVPGI